MKKRSNNFYHRILSSSKMRKTITSLAIVASIALAGSTATASAAPNYLSVAKPSSVSQCNGGTWKTVYRWHYWRHERIRVFVPNWQKLGFNSRQQCVTYVTSPQPENQRQCDNQWRALGFGSRGDCIRYLRNHGGSGYGGSNFGTTNR